MILVGLCFANAFVPFYGYWVHASRDHQLMAYVLFACWVINWCVVLVVGAWLVRLLISMQVSRLALVAVLEFVLVTAGLLAQSGVLRAIMELLV